MMLVRPYHKLMTKLIWRQQWNLRCAASESSRLRLRSLSDAGECRYEFILGKTAQSATTFTNILFLSLLFIKAALISIEQVCCAQEGDSSSIRSLACHSLASVRRRQTVWLGTHTICSSLMSTSFQPIEALSTFFSQSLKKKKNLNQVSLGVWSGWREKLPSLAFIIWLQILRVHFFPFYAGPFPLLLLA